jgi:hypothetical protein
MKSMSLGPAQAQVGIAMGTGTDVAMETGGITLVKGDLRGIVKARRLSQRTILRILLQRDWSADCCRCSLPLLRLTGKPHDRGSRHEL